MKHEENNHGSRKNVNGSILPLKKSGENFMPEELQKVMTDPGVDAVKVRLFQE